MSKPRAVRLSETEEELVHTFLQKNPFFDFSSLVRTALLQFIKSPKLPLVPVREPTKSMKRDEVRQ